MPLRNAPRPDFPLPNPMSAKDRELFLAVASVMSRDPDAEPDFAAIAKEARVPEAQLRARFPQPEALLPATLTFLALGMGHGILDATGGRGFKGLRGVVQNTQVMAKIPRLFEFYCTCMERGTDRQSPLNDWLTGQVELFSAYLANCITTGIADGEISDDIDITAVVNTILPLHFGSGRYWDLMGSSYDVAETMSGYIDLLEFRYGIRSA